MFISYMKLYPIHIIKTTYVCLPAVRNMENFTEKHQPCDFNYSKSQFWKDKSCL